MPSKIRAQHLKRRAFVYVRQSTSAQVFENTESTARQYALAERARALGWCDEAIEVIDEDLGRSGASTTDRTGFARLAEAVAHGDAGAILTVEVSRVARSSQDWQRLLSLCGVADVVVVDEHTVYDPRDGDDKLLLDFKGTMSEAELRWLRLRLHGARKRKAARGELRFAAPTGYVWGDAGLEPDPDSAVRQAIATILGRFQVEPTAHAVVRWARQEGVQVPTRRTFRDGTGELTWKPLSISRLKEILKSPIYAGAYAWGRRTEEKALVDGEIQTVRRTKDPEEWLAFIQNAHEGYISWERYLSNREKMRANAARTSPSSAPRDGRALLAGILVCGRCGRSMRTTYSGRAGSRWTYACFGDQGHGAAGCWTLSGVAVDRAVEKLFLDAVVPDELALSLAVEREVESQAGALREQWRLRQEQAEYEARRAERRYKAVDPDNRVVARTLEDEWETRLRDLDDIRQQYESAKRERRVGLSDRDRERVRALAHDLPSVWRAPTTAPADRKAMLRLAIEAVALSPIDVPSRRTHLRVQWRSGAVDELTIDRPGPGDHGRTPRAADERVLALTAEGLDDKAIAARLRAEGLRTGAGNPWSAETVKHARLRLGAGRVRERTLPDRREDGRYSIPGAARHFGVRPSTIHRWVARGRIEAIREDYGHFRSAWWLTIDAATERDLLRGRTLQNEP